MEEHIAPPGQEGWREAPGWLFRKSFLNNHLVRAGLEAPRYSFSFSRPYLQSI
jgi:hypothetical protein